jgi:hypothetical protein
MFVLAACTRSDEPTASVTPLPRSHQPTPVPAPTPAIAPANADPITLPIAAPSASTPSNPSTGRFGVRWRVQLPGLDPVADDTVTALVVGDEVFVSMPVLAGTHDEIDVFDLATGSKLRSARVTHVQLVAAQGMLVATNGDQEFGLDKQTLSPTWHARASLRRWLSRLRPRWISVSDAERASRAIAVDDGVLVVAAFAHSHTAVRGGFRWPEWHRGLM